jgi:nitroreductase
VNELLQVLELARWAPSGDNTQPWRFAIEGPGHVAVHAHDTRATCVYDLDGHPSQISVGALLESIALAATRFGLRADVARREGADDAHPVFDVRLRSDAGVAEDPLVPLITERCVQRRPLRRTPLRSEEKDALAAAVAPGHALQWFDTPAARRRMAWLNFDSAKIRLTIPEAYAVHAAVIEWGASTSIDRVPAGALGASAASLALMRWAMRSWQRVARLNRYAAGTLAPRIELDLVPGLACAGHAALVAPHPPRTIDDYVAAGRALQRFWLTATRLGLQFQPQYTPLVFARYVRDGVAVTATASAQAKARAIAARLEGLLGAAASNTVFMGRIGHGPAARARSLRLPLAALMLPAASAGTTGAIGPGGGRGRTQPSVGESGSSSGSGRSSA